MIKRKAVALTTAPRSGPGRQDLDLALTMADEGPRGRADPAYDSHALPIVTYAKAVWHRWESTRVFEVLRGKAEQQLSKA